MFSFFLYFYFFLITPSYSQGLEIEIDNKECKKLLHYIEEDRTLRKKGIRDNNVYARVLDNTEFDFKDRASYLINQETVVFIGDKRFFDSANRSFRFDAKHDKILKVTACTVNFNESKKRFDIVPVQKSRAKIITTSDNKLTDDRILFIEYPNVEEGSYLVFICNAARNYVPGTAYGRLISDMTKYSVEDVRYYNYLNKFIIPQNVEARTFISPNNPLIKNYTFKTSIDRINKKKIYEFNLKRASYIEREDHMYLDDGFLPYFVFSTYESWDYINEFLLDIYSKRLDSGLKDVKQELKKMARVLHKKQSELTVEDVYYYVRDHYRYVYAHDAYGNFIPNDLGTIIREKSGDCKDKTFLAYSLLKLLKVDVYMTMIMHDSSYSRSLNLPGLELFNHQILAYKDKGELKFMDLTVATLPYSYIPLGIADRNYLAVSNEGPLIGVTPSPSGNRYSTFREIEIDEQGNGKEKTRVESYGTVYSFDVRDFRTTKQGQLDILSKDYVFGYDSEITSFKLDNLYNNKEPFIINFEAKSNRIVDRINDLLIFPKVLTKLSESFWHMSSNKRLTPVIYKNDLVNIFVEWVIKLPETCSVRNLPDDFEYKSPYLELKITRSYDGKKIKQKQEVKYLKRYMSPEDYMKEKNNMKKVFDYKEQKRVVMTCDKGV